MSMYSRILFLGWCGKKGPYSIEDIFELKLAGETLIFSDDLNKWVPFKELEDFKEKEDKSYVAGSCNKIITFDELYSDIYYIGNVKPTSILE
jgi:hypothetical protein